ncbi:hypothetical protein NYO99_20640 [Pelomonas sp. UHG3]|uniref:Uncharacterized protein n=1 Tax=Roseateles hydrophilus TaxID=2975054 RepID=A0ACC6CG93_9BURK|nr:hypothetical protein [Pelomonas sp. UHG3]MCY4747392.1 hypothetical protein [Pelomonas sp. UHG3]
MAGLIAVTHRLDLPSAAALREQQQAELLVADPLLCGRVISHPLPEPQVFTRVDAAVARGALAEALTRARALGQALAPWLAQLVPGSRQVPWSTHRYQQLFWTALGYRGVWQQVLAAHEPERWHVILPRQPHRYGGHSFVPGLMLLEQLVARGKPHAAYLVDVPSLDGGQLPDLRQLPADVQLLAHLPTCFHDAAHFSEEILASGLRCGLLSAEVYDVPLEGLPATGLVDAREVRGLLPPERLAALDALAGPVCDVLREHLQPVITHKGFRDTQVTALWQALEAQALLCFWLAQHFAGRLPRRLLLSNHDATIHGALLSFAASHAIPVTLVPHSKVFNQPVFNIDGLDALCLHHGLQDGPCLDFGGRQLPAGRLAYPGGWPEPPPPPAALKTVGVVLNGLSANGVSLLSFEDYAAGLAELLAGCRALGLQPRLRARLAETPLQMLAQRLALPLEPLLADTQGSLVDFAAGCDLLLGYDMPTSGLHEVLRAGVGVLQAEIRPLASDEWKIVDRAVAPRMHPVELMDRLRVMAANPACLHEFLRTQQQRARDAQAGARPLRDWLVG